MKTLNILLAIIALNLTVLSLVLTGVIPSAMADEPTTKPQAVQVVRLAPNEVLDVNVREVGGSNVYREMPVVIKNQNEIDVNIDEVGGSSIYGGRLKVEVD